ncbi:hypothetical protein [Paracoccus sp. ME4]|uniref:hypothetical protein n=1 Tax=Paracoccus sp. ME4 TaxID=3138066 RepID=UPI00398B18C2
MTKFIPFPPASREIAASNAAASYARDHLKGKGAQPRERIETGFAAYRQPDGTVRTAHNLYKAEAPEGATPGIAQVRYAPIQSVNGHEGYDAHAFGFVPSGELSRSAPLHDPAAPQDFFGNLSAALVTHEGRSAILWAIEEAQLAEWEKEIPKDATFERIRVERPGMERGVLPGSAVMVTSSGAGWRDHLVIVTATDEDMRAVLPRVLPNMVEPDASLQEMLDVQLPASCERHGWAIISQTGMDLPDVDSPLGKDRIGLLNTGFQHEIMIPAFGKPVMPYGVMLRGGEQLRFASIRMGDTDPVMVWAYDDAALERRIANTLMEADGSDRRLGHFDTGAEAVIAEMKDALPDLEIRKGRGGSHMAWGYEPSHIAMGTEIASGHHFGFASSNEDHLCQIGADLMAPEAETCDIDDLNDLRWKPEVKERFEILDMRKEDLPVRRAALRDAIQAHRNLTPELG